MGHRKKKWRPQTCRYRGFNSSMTRVYVKKQKSQGCPRTSNIFFFVWLIKNTRRLYLTVPVRLHGELGWFLHFNMCNFRLISLLTWEDHLGFNMLQIFKQQTGQRCSHDETKVSVPRLYLVQPCAPENPGRKTQHGVPFLFRQPALCWWLTQFDEIDLFENCFVVFCKGILFNPLCKQSFYIPTKALNRTRNQKFTPFPMSFERRGSPAFITNQPPAYHQARSATKAGGFFDFDDLPDASPLVEGGGLQPKMRHFDAVSVKWWYFSKIHWDE